MKFPILGFGQTNQTQVANNRDNLTTEEAVALAEQRINFLEGELAKGGLDSQSRAGLMSELRSYKTFKASMIKAISEGQVKPNEKMFNNKGRPTAAPGSWVGEAMKSFRMSEGMDKGGRGPQKGPKPKSAPKGYSPATHKMYKKRGVEVITGNPGALYPGMTGYVFDNDGTTPVRMTVGQAFPGSFPNTKGKYMVFADTKAGVQQEIIPGFQALDKPKEYYSKTNAPGKPYHATPVDADGNIITYTPRSTSTQAQIVVGRPGLVHAPNGIPTKATTASNVAWIGSGNSHVYPAGNYTTNNPKASLVSMLQKQAGILVPGQTDRVFAENVQASYVQVRPGVMVPGSGNHATAGGAARRLMYKSSNPAQSVAWTAGGDATFNSQGATDSNPATRFNASGQIATFSPGQAHPTKSNTVFDADFTDYAKRSGAEVPGSAGYDVTEAAKTPDGLGPSALVYDAGLNPVAKQRGNPIPGQGVDKVYGDVNTSITIAPGQGVIIPSGTSSTDVYSRNLNPVTKARGLLVPTADGKAQYQSIYTAQNAQANIVTLSEGIKGEDSVAHTLRALPFADAPVATIGKQDYSAFVFDPSTGSRPGFKIQSLAEQGRAPSILFLPGDAKQLSVFAQKGAPLDLRQALVAPIPDTAFNKPLSSGDFNKSAVPFEFALEQGLVQPEVGGEARSLTIRTFNAGKPETAVVSLAGMRRMVSPMNRQGGPLGASSSTTTSTRASGAYRVADSRAEHRWI